MCSSCVGCTGMCARLSRDLMAVHTTQSMIECIKYVHLVTLALRMHYNASDARGESPCDAL